MKIVTRNKRSPRKYSEFEDVYLMDDAGIIWGAIDVRDGRISIRHIQGVVLHTSISDDLGDYRLPRRSYRFHMCPNCDTYDHRTENQKVYDTLTDKVKCSKCGHTWCDKEAEG